MSVCGSRKTKPHSPKLYDFTVSVFAAVGSNKHGTRYRNGQQQLAIRNCIPLLYTYGGSNSIEPEQRIGLMALLSARKGRLMGNEHVTGREALCWVVVWSCIVFQLTNGIYSGNEKILLCCCFYHGKHRRFLILDFKLSRCDDWWMSYVWLLGINCAIRMKYSLHFRASVTRISRRRREKSWNWQIIGDLVTRSRRPRHSVGFAQ